MANCYRCGSIEGTETTLCPACRKERHDNQKNFRERVNDDYRFTLRTLFQIIIGEWKTVFFMLLIAGAGAIYYYYFSNIGPGYFSARTYRINSQCIKQAESARTILLAGAKELPMGHLFAHGGVWDNEIISHFGETMGKTINQGLHSGDDSVCRDIHTECASEPSSDFCERLYNELDRLDLW